VSQYDLEREREAGQWVDAELAYMDQVSQARIDRVADAIQTLRRGRQSLCASWLSIRITPLRSWNLIGSTQRTSAKSLTV